MSRQVPADWRKVASLLLACGVAFALFMAATSSHFRDGVPVKPGESAQAQPRPANPYSIPVLREPQRPQLRYFPVLRTRPEEIPPTLKALQSHPAYGMNWNYAQRLYTSRPIEYWLIPGNGLMCLLAAHRRGVINQTCALTTTAIAKGLFLSFLPAHQANRGKPRSRLTAGVVPAGVEDVLVRTGRESATTHAKENGFFALRDAASSSPGALAFRASKAQRESAG
jgi:hypothetical protein